MTDIKKLLDIIFENEKNNDKCFCDVLKDKTMRINLAGFSKDDVKLSLVDDYKLLIITAEKEGFESVEKRIKLPQKQIESINSKMENGLLELEFVEKKRQVTLNFD